jgi:large subunit ribosomal protein L18
VLKFVGEVLRRKQVNQLKNKIMSLTKPERRQRIRFRIRKTISGTAAKPYICIRSNKENAQLIDDVNGVTFTSSSSREKEIVTVRISQRLLQQLENHCEKALKAGIEVVTSIEEVTLSRSY